MLRTPTDVRLLLMMSCVAVRSVRYSIPPRACMQCVSKKADTVALKVAESLRVDTQITLGITQAHRILGSFVTRLSGGGDNDLKFREPLLRWLINVDAAQKKSVLRAQQSEIICSGRIDGISHRRRYCDLCDARVCIEKGVGDAGGKLGRLQTFCKCSPLYLPPFFHTPPYNSKKVHTKHLV